MKDLETRFDCMSDVTHIIRKKLRELPSIGEDEDFSSTFQKMQTISDNCDHALNIARENPELGVFLETDVPMIRSKLPDSMNQSWREKKSKIKKKYGEKARFSDFSKFLRKEVDMLRSDKPAPQYSPPVSRIASDEPASQCFPPVSRIATHLRHQVKSLFKDYRDPHPSSTRFCKLHNSPHHHLRWCKAYLSMPETEQWFFRRHHQICDRCLIDHSGQPCPLKV